MSNSTAGLSKPVRIVIVGGGYVGMYTALGLQRKLSRGEREIVVIDPQSNMTYQPFLPEAAAGNVEPRHVVVPLRKVLKKCQVITGTRHGYLDHADKTVTIQPGEGEAYDRRLRPVRGAAPVRSRGMLPIPGLAEQGIGFKTDRRGDLPAQPGAVAAGRRRLDRRPGSPGGDARRSYSSAAATPGSRRWPSSRTWPVTPAGTTPTCGPSDMRWVLVEAASRDHAGGSVRTWRPTPSIGCASAASTSASTPSLTSAVGGHIELSDGRCLRRRDAGLDGRREGQPGPGRRLTCRGTGRVGCRARQT